MHPFERVTIFSPEEFDSLIGAPANIASHVEAPEAVWFAIIQEHPKLREFVAGNKTIPDSVIRRLYSCGDEDVLWWLAQKRRTPPDLLAELAVHSREGIRQRVVCNAKCPREVLETLTHDCIADIREHAEKRLRELENKQ